MLDFNLLNNNIDWVAHELARRKFLFDIDKFRQHVSLYRELQKKIENLQHHLKSISSVIKISKIRGENIEVLREKSSILSNKLTLIKEKIKILQKEIMAYQLSFPNIPDNQIPDGFEEKDNLEVFRWGELRNYDFKPLDHIALGELVKEIDLSSAAKITGTRFVMMRGKIALLHRALCQFMLDTHIKEHGYEECYLPYLVNAESLYGAGQLPKFDSDLFHIQRSVSGVSRSNSYSLIPTAEVPLINLMRDVIIHENELPIKMVAHTPCFRSEAGTYGRRSRGLIRTHQFEKVELVQIVHPDHSTNALEEITRHAEKILQLLKLPYRKMLLCAGNISFTACKTYDLEVWFPSYNDYLEVASCSNTKDFQSRRIKARFRSQIYKKLKLLHILNASGLAVGRTLAAVLENYQLKDGVILIPKVLYPYMHGITEIHTCV